MQLDFERKKLLANSRGDDTDSILMQIIVYILNQLGTEKPWRAKFGFEKSLVKKNKKEYQKTENYKEESENRSEEEIKINKEMKDKDISKEHLLVRATGLGLTSVAWWLCRNHVNTSLPDNEKKLPIQAAIDNQNWHTVEVLVRYMSTNPFIKLTSGDDSFLQMKEQVQQDVLKVGFNTYHCIPKTNFPSPILSNTRTAAGKIWLSHTCTNGSR